jgi:hypothetical protein
MNFRQAKIASANGQDGKRRSGLSPCRICRLGERLSGENDRDRTRTCAAVDRRGIFPAPVFGKMPNAARQKDNVIVVALVE